MRRWPATFCSTSSERSLGRGGGHYDRAFPPGTAGALLVGVGYAFQLVDAVPCGPGDRRLDLIVTEAGVLRSAPRAPERASESP